MTYNNNQTKGLNDFQKKKIEKRMLLNFFKELDNISPQKKRFSKVFSEQIDTLVRKFDEKGVMFFSLTIELSFLKETDNFWGDIHRDVEEFINYFGCHIELIEFCYFSIEMKGREPSWQNSKINERNMIPFINGIIGVRSLVGQNKSFIYEIKDIFLISSYDIKINWLSKNSEILKYWNFIIKQKNFKFHRFVNYSNFYPMVYGSIADEELKFDDQVAFGQENHFISNTMNIKGINKKFPKKKEIILYFIILFMHHKDMKVHNNSIYIKINNSKISWQLVYTLDEMKKKFNNIFDDLTELYPQQLENFNIIDLLLSDLDSVFKKIKKNNNLLVNIEFFDNLIEFKDGVFFFEKKKFFLFEDISNLGELKTDFYIDCVFSDLNSAEFLLNSLYKKFNKNSAEFLLK